MDMFTIIAGSYTVSTIFFAQIILGTQTAVIVFTGKHKYASDAKLVFALVDISIPGNSCIVDAIALPARSDFMVKGKNISLSYCDAVNVTFTFTDSFEIQLQYCYNSPFGENETGTAVFTAELQSAMQTWQHLHLRPK